MGFGFKDWKNQFYPSGLKSGEYLKYYSRYFNAVEIDSTFYGNPPEGTVQGWDRSTPDDFKICLKVPRMITHSPNLEINNYQLQEFMDNISNLGEKLGVVLFQFPPSFDQTGIKKLVSLMSGLPDHIRYAVEFRNIEWFRDVAQHDEIPLKEVLQEHRVCLASTSYPGVPKGIIPTTDLLYIRLIGKHGTYKTFDRVRNDKKKEIENWLERVRNNLSGIETVYIFVNNDYTGYSIKTANQINNDLTIDADRIEIPRQIDFLSGDS